MTNSAQAGGPSGAVASSRETAAAEHSKSMTPEAGAAFVAVIITLVVTAIVLVCLFRFLKYWTLRHVREIATIPVTGDVESRSRTEGAQLYSQNISELSIERTESEMQYEESHELMGRGQCQELPGNALRRPRASTSREPQGLLGEKHDRELVSSLNR